MKELTKLNRKELAEAHVTMMQDLGVYDELMVTTRSPMIPLNKKLKEANRAYRKLHHERVSPVYVCCDAGVHHAHEAFQKRPSHPLDFLRLRLTAHGSVMATFHPGAIKYLAKNFAEDESAEIEYDHGMSTKRPPTIAAPLPSSGAILDAGELEDSPQSLAGDSRKKPSGVSGEVAEGGEPDNESASTGQGTRRNSSCSPIYDSALYKWLKIGDYVDDMLLMLHVSGTNGDDYIDEIQLAAFGEHFQAYPDAPDFVTVQSMWYGKLTRFILFQRYPADLYGLIDPWLRLGGTASVWRKRGLRFQLARIKGRPDAVTRWDLAGCLRPRPKRLSWAGRRTRIAGES
jgi:hypothetical protein